MMKKVFHIFSVKNHYYVFDFHSVAIFELGKNLFLLLQENEDKPFAEFKECLAISSQEYVDEIIQVIEEGFLFVDEDKWSREIEYDKRTYHGAEVTVSISLGAVCNLRCEYCFLKDSDLNISLSCFSIKDIKKQLFVLLNQYSKLNISLSNGGEPMLYKKELLEVCKLIRFFNGNNYNVSLTIVTNGTIYDEEIILALSEISAILVFSIDGSTNDHNKSRKFADGKPTFDIVATNLKRIAKNLTLSHVTRNIWSSSIVTQNTHSIVQGLKDLKELGCKTTQFKLVKGMRTSIGITKASLPHFLLIYEDLFDFLERTIMENDPSYLMMIMNNGDTVGSLLILILLEEIRYKRCYAATQTMAIDGNGTIYPCMFLNGIQVLSMGMDMENAIKSTVASSFRDLTIFSSTECMNCWVRTICGGWCPYHSAVSCDNMNAPDENVCKLTRFIAERIIHIVNLLESDNEKMYQMLCSYCSKRRSVETI